MKKYKLRITGEEVEVISYSAPQGTTRSDIDCVSYRDNKGEEHYNVQGLNIYWDLEEIEESKSKEWEYLVEKLEIDDDKLCDTLNNFGKDGWELVTTINRHLAKLCIFKRPKL